jgi:small-conductance mechanosensitive channel
MFVTGQTARADEPASSTSPVVAANSVKVRQLLDLLNDPDIRNFLNKARETQADLPLSSQNTQPMAASLADRLESLRNHLSALARSAHELPSQAQMAHSMALDAIEERGLWSTAFALAAFVVLGFGAQGVFHLIGRRFRRWLLALTLETVDQRVRAVFARLLYGLGLVVSYALGSIGAFLLFDWPSLIKRVLLGYLVAFLIVRLFTIVGRFLLAPGAVRFRVVPLSTEAAWFFYVRLIVFATILSFGTQSIDILAQFGFSQLARELSTDALALVLVGLGIEALWRMPPLTPIDAALDGRRQRHRNIALLLSLVCVLLWVTWTTQARLAFWLIAFAATLPIAILTARASVAHILRPAGADIAQDEARSFQAVMFERGVRSFIIISAALLLAWIFDVDVVSLTMRDTVGTRILRGAISVIVIALLSDVLWTFIRAVIDRKMKQPLPHSSAGSDAGHAARLQTLLPIVSNILLATIVIVSAMMMLAALGIQIGPLIASAGVVGVAIGFGAQTLVKDVISGIFYLVDDAFRIGEYIQSGNYKGTVESFSLRSVKLRHQRGALYTVPFGVLGAVQNQSRDWVVDKIAINVPYDTDLDKVRKLIKKIGLALSEDPEFGPEILSPLKMQGVAQFGDFAIQIQTKMMTRPGDVQFGARRRALLLIKQAFEENGIGFAMPMVQVSGDNAPAAAAARSLALSTADKVG